MGSTLTFRLRDSSGQAVEFINYVSPVEQKGRYFFLSGIRKSVSEPFQYLFIPADDQVSLKRFFNIRTLLNNPQAMQRIAEKTALLSLPDGKASAEAVSQISVVMQRLADLFNRGGFDQVLADINDKVPEDKRDSVTESYFKVLQTILGTVYLEVLQQEGVDISADITPAQEQFYDDMVNTMGVLANYASPVYIQIKSFEHKQASGFQITKATRETTVTNKIPAS